MIDTKKLGYRLANEIDKQGTSIGVFCGLHGLKRQDINELARGTKKGLTLKKLSKWADALGTTCSALLEGLED